MEEPLGVEPHHVSLPTVALRGAACSCCFRCPKEGSKSLLSCGRCTLAKYCGSDCQKAHWPAHQHDCSKIAAALKGPIIRSPGQYPSLATLMTMRWGELMELGEVMAPRKLNVNEHKFLQFRPYCSFCFKTRSPGVELLTCPTCYHHSRCRGCEDTLHPPHTREMCNTYQLVNRQEIFLFNHHQRFGKQPLAWAGQERVREVTPLPEDWLCYFRARSAPDFPPEVLVALTRQSSLALTVLLGLHRVYPLADLKAKSSLTIHLVGADSDLEFPPSLVWEEILHLLPNLRTLTIICCGPGITMLERDGSVMSLDKPGEDRTNVECCEACQALGICRLVGVYAGLYHDFAKKKAWQRPDLAVGFNTGMHEDMQGTWAPTLRLIIDQAIPFIFTSFNAKEAEQDADTMEAMGAKLLCRQSPNPWKDLCPRVDDEYVDGFFHVNYQYAIALGKVAAPGSEEAGEGEDKGGL